jgi:hypothetical protein
MEVAVEEDSEVEVIFEVESDNLSQTSNFGGGERRNKTAWEKLLILLLYCYTETVLG